MDIYDNNRKVVLVRGDKAKGYEQAIFILSAGAHEKNIDFIKEAEKIINSRSFTTAAAGHLPKYNSENYARAEMLPPQPAPRTTATRQTPKNKKKTSRFDVMLNFALVVTGIAVVVLFSLNFM